MCLPIRFDKMCQTVLEDVLQAYLSCHSRPVIPHLASSCNYWVSRLSSSPASPTASYEPLPSGDTVHRCFDDHLPPVELHINFLVWLQSHSSPQLCILTYNHLTCFASRAGFCPPALWFSVTLPHPVCLSLTPLLHDLSTACGLAVSILKGGGGSGGMLPCEGDNDLLPWMWGDSGHLLWGDGNKGRGGTWEEQHALIAQMQVNWAKYNCQHEVF